MPTVKKIVNKALGRKKKVTKIQPIDYNKVEEYRGEVWESDKILRRDRAFRKAQRARRLQVDAINAEKERQNQITKNRLKNLKKARKKLAKNRSKK